MVSHFQDHESLLHNSIFDALYCDEEERFDENSGPGFFIQPEPEIEIPSINNEPFELDLLWDDDEVVALLGKEREQQSGSICDGIDSDGDLRAVRGAAIGWMLKAIGFYGFNAMTAVLAVNYFDRFVTSVCFQKDKPWMGQLAAVACLSIAAKVEENKVPLLLDLQLQVEESKYVFEAKTIQRMELLVLSTLKWKMNPVTPISFVDHITRRFGLITNLHLEFLRRCERVILSIITDCRLGHYLPSVIAAATMIHAMKEIGTCDANEYQNQLMIVLRTSMEHVNECHKLIVEAMGDVTCKPCQKRKHECVPSSPSGVIDAYFSSDSSVDSWAAAAPSVSPSPDRLCKRNKTHDHNTRLAQLSSITNYPQ